MPYFTYHAVNKAGQEKIGTISANNKNEAIEKIRGDKLYITKIYQVGKEEKTPPPPKLKSARKFLLFHPKVKSRDVVTFVRDLAILIEAGIPITRSLSVIEEQDISPAMREVVVDLRTHVETGHSLSEVLLKYPKIFPELFVNLTRSGEAGGGQILSEVLLRLADLYENTERLNARIKAAITYPIFVLVFAILVVIGLVTFILPKFFVIYADLNLELPAITSILFKISMVLKKYFLVFIGIGLALLYSLPKLLFLPKVRLWWDGLKLKFPVFGVLLSKLCISRFARNLGTLHNSGVPILQALDIVKGAVGNKKFEIAIESIKESVREGEGISAPLSQFPIFPPLVTNMIAVGEETGTVGDLLIKISNKYDEDTEIRVAQLTSLLEPMLILILGVLVGFIIIALFFPLVSLMQQISG